MADQALTAPAVSTTEIELIKKTVAHGATDEELQLFLYDCRRRNVHPLDKMIYFAKSGGSYKAIVGIDYLRSRAALTGEYAGSSDPVIRHDDEGRLVSASMTVYRLVQGQRCEFSATALFAEYCPNRGGVWTSLPTVMLSKVVESLCLRKGFPETSSGLYTREEFAELEVVDAPRTTTTTQHGLGSPVLDEDPPLPEDPTDSMMGQEDAPVTRPMTESRKGNGADRKGNGNTHLISEKQARRLYAITMQAGRDPKDISDHIDATYGYTHSSQIERSNYDAICDFAAGTDG